MGILNVTGCAFQEVFEEVCEDFYRSLVEWKWGYIVNTLTSTNFRAKVQFKPWKIIECNSLEGYYRRSPFGFHPVLIFSYVVDILFHGFCTHCSDLPTLIVVDHGGDC